ncbi:MAG TPA: O-antigen ligase family protein [Patescibacteria group bacterium]|nr:O-antigen ligase family protein [Patescibacteria group bacterium]
MPKLRLLIILFTVWQYISILGIAVLNWPAALVWLNLGLLLAFIFLCPVYESLLLLILSIPFFVVLPNSGFDSLSMWRILYAVLFMVWLLRDKKYRFAEIRFLPWDKYLGYFFLVAAAVTLLLGRFRTQGLKELLFLLNVYLLYLVLINVLKSKQQIFEVTRYVIWSLAIIVTLGFTQLIGTFLTNLDTFWVYWATNISRLYYGSGFASVALYSNSWFSYTGGRELRMFSIMPDSQSFAYICIVGLCMGTALTRSVFKHIRKWLWSGIRFAGLALILSGTRAVWVGMAAPLLAVLLGYFKNIQKHLAKKYLWPFIIILLLFFVSPFINKGLDLLRVGNGFKENFLARAESIYDVNDISNQGRLAIWASSLKFAFGHPLGVGESNFIVSLGPVPAGASYEQVSNEVNERYNLPKKYISAHDLYLQVLVETGLAGLILLLWFFWSVLRYFWNFIRHYEKTEDFLVYFVAQAFLLVLWIMAAAVFDVTLLNDKVLMFFFLDLGLAGVVVQRYHEYKDHED